MDANGRLAALCQPTAPSSIGHLDRVGAVDDGLVGGVRQALAPAVGCGPQRGGEDEPAPAVDGGHGLDDVTVGDRPELELPFGEGAGLVEAQHVRASERFEDAGVADEDALARETPRRARLRDRREEWQSLGHGGRSEADAGRDCVAGTSAAQQA